MSLGLNQSFWLPSLVVSIAAHGIALVVLNYIPISMWLQSQKIKPIPPEPTYIEASVVYKTKPKPGEYSQPQNVIANEPSKEISELDIKASAKKKTTEAFLANKPSVHSRTLIEPKPPN